MAKILSDEEFAKLLMRLKEYKDRSLKKEGLDRRSTRYRLYGLITAFADKVEDVQRAYTEKQLSEMIDIIE